MLQRRNNHSGISFGYKSMMKERFCTGFVEILEERKQQQDDEGCSLLGSDLIGSRFPPLW